MKKLLQKTKQLKNFLLNQKKGRYWNVMSLTELKKNMIEDY